MLVAVSIVGVLLHVLMDLPTSYGTRLLSPFNWHWFAADWMPIVDIYLLVALVAVCSAGRRRQRRAKAAVVLLLMAANYGVRGVAHHEALVLAPRLFGPTLPPPCDPPARPQSVIDSWPRAGAAFEPAARQALPRRDGGDAVVPVAVQLADHRADVERLRDPRHRPARSPFREPATDHAPWRLTLRFPNVWTPAVSGRADASRPGVPRLLTLAGRAIGDRREGITTVRWTDMRFAGGLAPTSRGRAPPVHRHRPDRRRRPLLEQFLGLSR